MAKVNLDIADKVKLVEQEGVKESFTDVLVKIHRLSSDEANTAYEKESMYFKKLVFENEWLKTSTGLSLYSSFLEVAINHVSLQPGAKSESYLEARSANQPKEGKDNWVKVARLVITAYGELNMRIKAGQIIRMNNPIVLYGEYDGNKWAGDKFRPHTNDRGELTIDYEPAIPRKKNKEGKSVIFGVWCSIVLPHNGIDFKWLLEDDIERLRVYSIPKKADAVANALYTANGGQIDPGFLEAKCIKHAMRAYTKLKISDNVAFEGDDEFEDQSKDFSKKEEVKTVQVQQSQEEDEEVF